MDNQHQKIKGYRDLSQQEIDMMNKIKTLGEELAELTLELTISRTFDQRWVAIGTTDLQTGIMALVRSVARPGGF